MEDLIREYKNSEELIEALKAKRVEAVEVIHDYDLSSLRLCPVSELKVLLDREEYFWYVDVLENNTVLINFLI